MYDIFNFFYKSLMFDTKKSDIVQMKFKNFKLILKWFPKSLVCIVILKIHNW